MDVLSEKEMAERLDFRRPLKAEHEEAPSMWCIPFGYGSNHKSTTITISKAREIAAQLRADIAEAEKAELLRLFKREEERANALSRSAADYQKAMYEAQCEVAALTRKLRAKRSR